MCGAFPLMWQSGVGSIKHLRISSQSTWAFGRNWYRHSHEPLDKAFTLCYWDPVCSMQRILAIAAVGCLAILHRRILTHNFVEAHCYVCWSQFALSAIHTCDCWLSWAFPSLLSLTGCLLDTVFHSQWPFPEGSCDEGGPLQLHCTRRGQPKWLLWAIWPIANVTTMAYSGCTWGEGGEEGGRTQLWAHQMFNCIVFSEAVVN